MHIFKRTRILLKFRLQDRIIHYVHSSPSHQVSWLIWSMVPVVVLCDSCTSRAAHHGRPDNVVHITVSASELVQSIGLVNGLWTASITVLSSSTHAWVHELAVSAQCCSSGSHSCCLLVWQIWRISACASLSSNLHLALLLLTCSHSIWLSVARTLSNCSACTRNHWALLVGDVLAWFLLLETVLWNER